MTIFVIALGALVLGGGAIIVLSALLSPVYFLRIFRDDYIGSKQMRRDLREADRTVRRIRRREAQRQSRLP